MAPGHAAEDRQSPVGPRAAALHLRDRRIQRRALRLGLSAAVAQKLTIAWRRVDPWAPGSGPGGTMGTHETAANEYGQACLAEDLGEDVLALAAVAEAHRPASVLRKVNGKLVRLIVEAA